MCMLVMKGDKGSLNFLLFLLNGPEVCRSGCGFPLAPVATTLGLGLRGGGPVRGCGEDAGMVQ